MSILTKYNNTYVILPPNYIPLNEKSQDLITYYFKIYYNIIYLDNNGIKDFINKNNNENIKIIFYFNDDKNTDPKIYNFYLEIINFIQNKNDIKSKIFIFTFDFWIRSPGCYRQLICKTFNPKNYKVITFAYNLQHLKIFLNIEDKYSSNIIYNNYWAAYKESYQPFNNNPVKKIFLSGVISNNYIERQILKNLNSDYIYEYKYNSKDVRNKNNNYNKELNKYIACFSSSVYVKNIHNKIENTHAILLKIFEILASGSLLIMPLIEEKYLNNIGIYHKKNCYLINTNNPEVLINNIEYIVNSKNTNEINIIRKQGQNDVINIYNYKNKFIELNNIIHSNNIKKWFIYRKHFTLKENCLIAKNKSFLKDSMNHSSIVNNKIELNTNDKVNFYEIKIINSNYFEIIIKS